MFTISIAEISDSAGNNSDGIVRGQTDQVHFTDAYSSIEEAEDVYAYNVDLAGLNIEFTDYSSAASGHDGPNAFMPWGTNATFSAGDSVYVASTEDVAQLRFTIDTPGVWTGPGLQVWDSTNGIEADRQLTVTLDQSDGFRNGPGTYIVEWATPSSDRVAFSPVPSFITSRKWIVVKPESLTAPGTSPKMSIMYMLGTNSGYDDQTLVFNAAMTDGSFGTVPDVVYDVGQAQLFTFPSAGFGLDLMVHRKSANVRDMALQYYASDLTWKALPNLSDPSTWMKNGPATLSDPPQLFHIRWAIPSDWTSQSLAIPLEGGGTRVITGWHMRAVVTSFTGAGPQTPALARGRCRPLSASGGVYHLDAKTYTMATFEAGVPCVTPTIVELVNINSGQCATMTIPAHTYSSSELGAERIVLSSPLTIGAGEALLITWDSGGTLQNVELVLQ